VLRAKQDTARIARLMARLGDSEARIEALLQREQAWPAAWSSATRARRPSTKDVASPPATGAPTSHQRENSGRWRTSLSMTQGSPDEDQARGEPGPEPHVRHAGGLGTPAQEAAQSPPRAAEDRARSTCRDSGRGRGARSRVRGGRGAPQGNSIVREWKPSPVGRTAAGDRVRLV